MKILVVAHQYWPVPGPASLRLGLLIKHLRAQHHDLTVLTTATESVPDELEGEWGERIVRIAGERSSGISGRRAIGVLRFAFEVMKWGRLHGPFDMVLSDPPPTAAWASSRTARRHEAKFVYYLSDCWSDSIGEVDSSIAALAAPIVRRLERIAWRSADLVVTVSRRLVRVAEAGGASNILLAENGVDLDRFVIEDLAWPDEIPDETPFFVYAGNSGEVHGATIFVDAAEELWSQGHDFALVYIGAGADSAALQGAADRWPHRIYCLGLRPPEFVALAHSGAIGGLCSVRPLTVNEDARPVKALTSLALGRPVVYAGSGEFADEITRQGLGKVSAFSKDAVAVALAAALKEWRDPKVLSVLSRHCEDYARSRWDQSSNMANVAQHIRNLWRE